MAVKEIIEIQAKTDKAIGEIENLRKEVESLTKAQQDTAKSTENIASNLGSLTKGALIGVALKAFEAFTEVLSNNQKVADFFATSLEFVSIAFNDLVNFILNNTQPVVNTFKAIFDDPLGSIQSLGDAIKNNLIERFNSFIETLGFVGDAVAALFAGDFALAGELAKEAGKEMVDVFTGVDGTVDKVTETVKDISEAVVDYTKETYKAADANVQLKKQAELSAIANQGLIEKYDRQAEIQRQIRDDETLSLETRRKANEELGRILELQAKEMKANAQIALDAANAELSKNKDNVEAIKARMEAENELAAIEAQIEGFRSEQKQNKMTLDREELDMIRSKAETEIDSEEAINMAKAEASELEIDRINAVAEAEDIAFAKRKQLLEDQIALQVEGSTARAEIENELAQLEAENDARKIQRAKEQKDFLVSLKQAEEDAKLDITANALSAAQGLAEEGSATYKALAVAQVLLDTFRGVQAAFASNAANVGATTLTGGAWPFIQAASAAAFGAANIAGILAVDPKSPSASVSRPRGATVAANTSAPAFNIVQAQQQTRLLNDISGAVGQPARAYVVSSDVSTAQELERKRIKNASF